MLIAAAGRQRYWNPPFAGNPGGICTVNARPDINKLSRKDLAK
jgi:hypothetical protein